MRSQLRGVEAVLSDGTVVSHLSGLVKDNTGYNYPGLLAGSEGTLAVVTRARLQLVPRPRDPVTTLAALGGLAEVHELARRALVAVPGLLSAEFLTRDGPGHPHPARGPAAAGLRPAAGSAAASAGAPAYLLLEADGPGALDDLAELIGDRPAAVATERRRPGRAVGLPGTPPGGGRASSACRSSSTWPCPPASG